MKIAIILGTRPEIIKMSPVIRECERRGFEYYILHTGQHYSYEMDRIFFDQLQLPAAKYNLDVGSGLHGEQTGKMLAGIEQVCDDFSLPTIFPAHSQSIKIVCDGDSYETL